MFAAQKFHATYTGMVGVLRSCSDEDVNPGLEAALLSTYQKAFNFLAAEFGSNSYFYDRCSGCLFVYCCVFQYLKRCPSCCKERYYQHGTH